MWLRNRSINVKLVKDKQDAKMDSDPTDLVRTITKGAVELVVVYMASDTLRKCIVHTVATRIT